MYVCLCIEMHVVNGVTSSAFVKATYAIEVCVNSHTRTHTCARAHARAHACAHTYTRGQHMHMHRTRQVKT